LVGTLGASQHRLLVTEGTDALSSVHRMLRTFFVGEGFGGEGHVAQTIPGGRTAVDHSRRIG
jgi:hypothetical protein